MEFLAPSGQFVALNKLLLERTGEVLPGSAWLLIAGISEILVQVGVCR